MAKGYKGPGMGRPKLLDNDSDTIQSFEALMGIPFVTAEAVAGVFKCSENTLVRWVKANYKTTFEALKQQKQSNIKLKLAGKQYELAMKGNVSLLIWLGKQWLGQSDKQEQTVTTNQPIMMAYDPNNIKPPSE